MLIIGILAGVAAPKLISSSSSAARTTTVANIRRVFDAADRYYASNGHYPANVGMATMPPELADYLDTRMFTSPPPIGGNYDWNGPGTKLEAFGVSIQRPAGETDDTEWLAIDVAYDDGDLSTGWIFKSPSYQNHLLFALAEP